MTKSTATVRLGENIRIRRDAMGLSDRDLAIAAGVEPSLVVELERGGVDPQLDTLLRIAVALECQVGELLDGVSLPVAEVG